jgi:hypothetical protein
MHPLYIPNYELRPTVSVHVHRFQVIWDTQNSFCGICIGPRFKCRIIEILSSIRYIFPVCRTACFPLSIISLSSEDLPMAVNKTTKWLAIIIAIPVTLIILSITASLIYFTGDRLRTMLIPPMESSLHRHVSVHDISLSLFPSIGVDIDSLRISNPDGSSFERDEFVALDRLRDTSCTPIKSPRLGPSRIDSDPGTASPKLSYTI